MRISVRCVFTRGNEILVQLSKKGDFYRLPGGRVRPDETLIKALKRELLEELGISVEEPTRLLYVVDSFYRRRSNIVHDIGFYFYCEKYEGDIKPREEHIRVKWIPLEKISKDNFRPAPLAELLKMNFLEEKPLRETVYIVNFEIHG